MTHVPCYAALVQPKTSQNLPYSPFFTQPAFLLACGRVTGEESGQQRDREVGGVLSTSADTDNSEGKKAVCKDLLTSIDIYRYLMIYHDIS